MTPFETAFGTDVRGLVLPDGLSATFVAEGVLPTVPGAASLSMALPAGTLYVGGTRVEKAAEAARAYTASRDTYIDISNAGVSTYVEVTNGAAEPALTANSTRVAKVVTNATQITSVEDRRILKLPIISVPNAAARPATARVGQRVYQRDVRIGYLNTGTETTPVWTDYTSRIKDIVMYNAKSPVAVNDVTADHPITDPGTITRITTRSSVVVAGGSLVVSIRKNGTEVLSQTIAAGAQEVNSTGLSIAVADGDRLTQFVSAFTGGTAGGKLVSVAREVVTS